MCDGSIKLSAMTRIILALALTVGLSGAAYLGLGRIGPAVIPFDAPPRVAQGERLYSEHCAACHGADLKGDADWDTLRPDGLALPPPLDESGHAWHHPDALLVDLVKRGPEQVVGSGYESSMPGFGAELSEAEILSVLAYVKSTWPLAILDVHDLVNGKPAKSQVRLEDLEACGISLGAVAIGGGADG